ncbi:gas vesicle protein [Halorarum halophilum]|uniref:Gas vesicle protein n=1 Tax=Halorarum halophilum TaxID=2743090 RepID=A0A7D5KEW6_9EURY|nr:gas vesicle protein GvpO [Halobaculum halophilum]QLG28557.1 gas vesicle protein [Halobaculum halophilum]
MANTQDSEQCRALTANGERCTRSAGEDGFCFQHDPEDETADDAAGSGDGADAAQAANEQGATATDGGTSAEQAESEGDDGDEGDENAEESDAGDDEEEQSDAESEGEDEEAEQADDEGDEEDETEQTDAEGDGTEGDISGVLDVRTLAESVTSDVVGAPLDRIIEIERQDAEGEGGWLVVVEALERKAIPDTEDLLGRYAIQFEEDGTVAGYRLRERYRRSAEISDE